MADRIANNRPEALTLEWLRLHGSEADWLDYEANLRTRRAVTDDHENRLRALEREMSSLNKSVADMKVEAHETRVEQTEMLKGIAAEVKAIAEKQTFEAGRAAGSTESNIEAASERDRRAKWFLPLIGIAVFFAVWALRQYIQEIQGLQP